MYFLLHPISSLNHLIARIITDQITFLTSIGLFIFIALNYKNHFWQSVDNEVSEWSLNSRDTFLKARSYDLAICGNAIFHIVFSIIFSIIVFLVKHRISYVIDVLFVLIFSWGLNRLLKIVFKRERPVNLATGIRKRLSYCFPSGHIMASISIYFFSAFILQNIISFLPWYIIALFISFFVVMSRIYLNHHYFTDVLGGICMGVFCLNISVWFYFFNSLL